MNNKKTEEQRIEEIKTDLKSVLLFNKPECYSTKLVLLNVPMPFANIDIVQELLSLDNTESLISQSQVNDSITQSAQPTSQEYQLSEFDDSINSLENNEPINTFGINLNLGPIVRAHDFQRNNTSIGEKNYIEQSWQSNEQLNFSIANKTTINYETNVDLNLISELIFDQTPSENISESFILKDENSDLMNQIYTEMHYECTNENNLVASQPIDPSFSNSNVFHSENNDTIEENIFRRSNTDAAVRSRKHRTNVKQKNEETEKKLKLEAKKNENYKNKVLEYEKILNDLNEFLL